MRCGCRGIFWETKKSSTMCRLIVLREGGASELHKNQFHRTGAEHGDRGVSMWSDRGDTYGTREGTT
ncbi:hypothetical protein DMENIID0001_061740 [Sergentomyia squamirostris]